MLAEPILEIGSFDDWNVLNVLKDKNSRVLNFSRSPISQSTHFPKMEKAANTKGIYVLRHIGIYACRVNFFASFY